jgi:DNA-3-methyladenine glycosylase
MKIENMRILSSSFYSRPTPRVARELLGKVLVHETKEGLTSGKIVETEAYLGERDPASRAYGGKRTSISHVMWGPPGRSFIYMVHANWLLNVVTEPEGKAGAVLLRALEPLNGIELMRKRRGVESLEALTSGPGRLTQALGITKRDHGIDLTDPRSHLRIEDWGKQAFRVGKSHRIGVARDLEQELRFYIEGNRFVSAKGSRTRGRSEP